MAETNPVPQSPGWQALKAHHDKIQGTTLKQLFAADPTRGEQLELKALGLYLDYSK